MNVNVGSGVKRNFEIDQQFQPASTPSSKGVTERDRQIAQLGAENLGKLARTATVIDVPKDYQAKLLSSQDPNRADVDGISAVHAESNAINALPLAKVAAVAQRSPSPVAISAESPRVSAGGERVMNRPLQRADNFDFNNISPRDMEYLGDSGKLRQRLKIDEFTSKSEVDHRLSGFRERLEKLEKTGDYEGAEIEMEDAQYLRYAMGKFLENTNRDHRGDNEQNAYRYYYTKLSESKRVFQNVANKEMTRIAAKPDGEGNVENIRRALNIDQFTSKIEADVQLEQYQRRLERLVILRDLSGAERHVNYAKQQRGELKEMLSEMQRTNTPRGDLEQNAYRFYNLKAKAAETILMRLYLVTGDLGKIYRDLEVAKFTSPAVVNESLAIYRGDLRRLEAQRDLKTAKEEQVLAHRQNSEMNTVIGLMTRRSIPLGESEQNAQRFYRDKLAAVNSLVEGLSTPQNTSIWGGLFGKK